MKSVVFKKFCLLNSKILKIMPTKKDVMLRKGCLLVIVLAFFLPLASAQSNELFDYHALNLNLIISNNFNVMPTSSDYFLDYASAKLTWYPKEDYRQIVELITTEPEADFREDDGFLFEWKQPVENNFLIEESSRIIAKNELVYITKKIDFPIKDLDPAYSEYLLPREIIDINEQIRQQASELVQGEDNLYSAVFQIASWVEQNIEYNLSTMTAEANQKASWVLDNQKGVCDEITSVFIALCRSVGIPARFVTGISYSNINLQNDGWGPHGWAEVYFPGYGWVPFDVTYKEFGFVDATHIKLKTTFDAKEISVDYSTKSRNTEIKPGQLEFQVNVIGRDYKLKPLVDVGMDVVEREIGFGSYSLLIVSVKNLHDYYITSRLTLADVNELKVIGDNSQSLLLGPNEKKELYWLVRVNAELNPDYIYTFPLKIRGSMGEEADSSIKASKRYKVYSSEYFTSMIADMKEESKPYSQNIQMTCSSDKQSMYVNESVKIICTLENKGDAVLRGLSICFDSACSNTKVVEGGVATLEYTKNFTTLGVKTLAFRAENELVDKSYFITLEIKDIPLIEIINLSFPKNISYKDTSEIRFLVKRKSNTEPRNMKIVLGHKLIREEWNLEKMENDYKVIVILKGESLNFKKNDFSINITYEDEQGKKYSLDDSFSIMLNNPNIFQRIMIWLHILEKKIEYKTGKWFSNI